VFFIYASAKVLQIEHNTKKTPFFFIVEMQRSLSKGTAKIRLSEENEKYFSFLSVRILLKSNTIQKKQAFFCYSTH